jgi:hypothetical protein
MAKKRAQFIDSTEPKRKTDDRAEFIIELEQKAKPIFAKWSAELIVRSDMHPQKGVIATYLYDFHQQEQATAMQMLREFADEMGLSSTIYASDGKYETAYYLEIER